MSHRIFTRTTTTSVDRADDGTFVLTSVLQDNVHDITLRITVDEELRILDAEGEVDAAPFAHECGQVSGVTQQLVGMQIGPGFSKMATERLGGPMGCHRYVDLVRDIARTAGQIPFLTLFHGKNRQEHEHRSPDEQRKRALLNVPNLENSCWSYNRANDGLFEVRPES